MNCEERGCLGTVVALRMTSKTIMLNCNKCTRQYRVPYKELTMMPQLPESVYDNIKAKE